MTKQLVVFKLGQEEYGLPIEQVAEIQKATAITKVPAVSPYIAGIFNARGRIIVLLDLGKRFDIPRADKPTHFVIIESAESAFALTVDGISGVLKVLPSEIKKSPELLKSRIEARFITGVVVTKDKRVIILLDPHELVKEEELKAATGG